MRRIRACWIFDKQAQQLFPENNHVKKKIPADDQSKISQHAVAAVTSRRKWSEVQVPKSIQQNFQMPNTQSRCSFIRLRYLTQLGELLEKNAPAAPAHARSQQLPGGQTGKKMQPLSASHIPGGCGWFPLQIQFVLPPTGCETVFSVFCQFFWCMDIFSVPPNCFWCCGACFLYCKRLFPGSEKETKRQKQTHAKKHQPTNQPTDQPTSKPTT